MSLRIDATRFRALQDQLTRLYREPVRDMAAIDKVIDQISAEQRALRDGDGVTNKRSALAPLATRVKQSQSQAWPLSTAD